MTDSPFLSRHAVFEGQFVTTTVTHTAQVPQSSLSLATEASYDGDRNKCLAVAGMGDVWPQ